MIIWILGEFFDFYRIYEKVFENKRIIGEYYFLFGERKKRKLKVASLYFINDNFLFVEIPGENLQLSSVFFLLVGAF